METDIGSHDLSKHTLRYVARTLEALAESVRGIACHQNAEGAGELPKS